MAGIGVRARAIPASNQWLTRLKLTLPRGRGLPAADWERRHRGLLGILWLHVAGVPAFGIAQGYPIAHVGLEAALLLAAALVGHFAPLGQRVRSGGVCVGLLTSSGLLVHFSGGFIEFHFHFFVMIALLTLYVDWFPFLLAVAYVLAHHGIVGVLDPASVYNHPDAIAHPWQWAGVHAGFVLAAGAANVFTWRMTEEEARRRSNIELVTEAALAKLPLAELLAELLKRIGEVVEAEISVVWLREEGQLVLRSVHGAPVREARLRLSAGDGFYGRIVSERAPAIATDLELATKLNPLHREQGVRAVAGVPLLVEGALVGVLEVASRQSRQFSETDLDLLQLVADRIGPAIDRARLYEQEHQIAATLQRGLLPKRLPDVPGLEMIARYLPAGAELSVGGDWYDVVELRGRRIALVMGDVAGHGSEAAALMGQLRTGLRAYATEGHPPEDVVGRLNNLVSGLDDHIMATLLYLEVDLGTWRGRLVNAGHPPPVLLEADGACRLLEGAHSPPLGAIRYASYSCQPVELEPGATLVLYTDGLVERRWIGLGMSLDALRNRVAQSAGRTAEEMCGGLVSAALNDGPLADDAAVLVVRRAAEGARPFEVELPTVPAVVPGIRRRIEHFVRSAGARPAESHDIVTSVCEACANAIQHAYGGRDGTFSLAGDCQDDAVVLTVRDRGAWRAPVDTDTGGRGLVLMRALMDDVRIERSVDGTTVTMVRRLAGGNGRP